MQTNQAADLISILVPVYNVEKYLDKCITSIVQQSYKNLEIILWDDGSTDGSGKLCDEWARRDSRIRCIHKSNGGVSNARNGLISNASGKYICFVDSDDYIESDYIEILYKNIISNDADMSGCCMDTFGSGERKVFSKESYNFVCEPEFFLKLLYEDVVTLIGPVCKLMKSRVVKNIVYPQGVVHEDGYTCRKIVMNCNTICWTSKVLYHYRNNHLGITNSIAHNKIDDDLQWIQNDVEFYSENNYDTLKVYAQKAFCYFLLKWWSKMNKDQKKKFREIYFEYMLCILRSDSIKMKVKIKYFVYYFRLFIK